MLGQYFNRNETWAEQAGPWVDYLSRSSYLLQQGRFVGDVAYFYGEEAPLTGLFGTQLATDLPTGYGFDFVNADVVLNHLKVVDNALTTPSGMRYRVLYLGGSSSRMTLPVLRKLRDLIAAGATVVGRRPEGSPSQADDAGEFQRIAAELWGTEGGAASVERAIGKGRVVSSSRAADVLAASGVAPDFSFEGATSDPQALFIHRQLPDTDIYFVTNRKNRTERGEMAFRVAGRAPQRWHAETGSVEPLSYRIENGRTVVPLDLEPLGSAFIVFRQPATESSRSLPVPTESPVLTVNGPWTIDFQAGRGAPAVTTLSALASWTIHADPGVRYFSGTGTYRTTFDLPRAAPRDGRKVLLDLGEVHELASVSVNGKPLGVLWHEPYRVDVTDALRLGSNTLELKVTNLWVNRLIGDAQPGAVKIAFTTGPSYLADAALRPSGLMGPVRLIEKR